MKCEQRCVVYVVAEPQVTVRLVQVVSDYSRTGYVDKYFLIAVSAHKLHRILSADKQ